ncbi:MAG: hypothetical protein ABI652_08560, partial [Acidobacteriota bacterium]
MIASAGAGAPDGRRHRQPVTFGVPLPQGAITDLTPWTLHDEDGRTFAAATRVLERWRDGSVRWMLVDSQVTVPSVRAWLTPVASESHDHAAPSVLVHRTADSTTIDTGSAKFVIRAKTKSIVDVLEPAGSPSGAPDGSLTATCSVDLTDPAGVVHHAVVSGSSVLHHQQLRARVAVDLAIESGPLRELELAASLDFYAGLSTIRVALLVRNPRAATHPGGFWDLGDPGSLLLKDLSFAIHLVADQDSAIADVSPEIGSAWSVAEQPVELYQDSSGGQNWRSTTHVNRERRVPNVFRGYRLRTGAAERQGLRATPIVRIRSGTRAAAVAVPYFWQNCPRAVEAAAGAVVVRFFPGQYGDLHELQGGEQKTHLCVVAFGADALDDNGLEWARSPLVVRADSEWHFSAAGVPWLAANDADHAALVSSAVDGPDSFDHKREVVDEYGWRNFGDVYGDHEAIGYDGAAPLVSHYNNQYDPIAGFIYQYLRTGDARWWTMADELAAHVIDIDIYHTTRDKWAYNNGLFWHTYHYGDA